MAKRRRSPQNKKLIATIAIAVLVVGAGFYAYSSYRANQDTNAKQHDIGTEAEIRDSQQKKEESSDRTKPDKGQTTETSGKASVFINRAGQTGTGTPLSVRATVTGTSSGTCDLTLTRDGQTTITRSFPIQVSGNSATCGSADIPAADFPVSGEWKLQVIAKDGSTSAPATTTVTITK